MTGAQPPWQTPPRRLPPVLLIVLASVLATLLLVGGAYWFFQRRALAGVEEKPKPTVPACDARRDERGFQISECYAKYAEATAAPALCEALPVAGEGRVSRGECIKRVALATGNAALCEGADAVSSSRCFREVAGAMEDVKLCEKVPRADERERCYGELARSLQDPEICRRVERDRERASCVSGALHVGTDVKVCDMLQMPSNRESCFSALARHDPRVCLQVPEPRRAQCLNMSSHVRELDDPAEPCGSAAECISAAAKFNIALCDRIPANEKARRSSCVENVLRESNRWVRASTCNQLQDLELRDVCFNRLGHNDDHESACQLVLNVAMRKECTESAQRKLAARP